MEDAESRDDIPLDIPYIDEESGSAYEEPSDAEQNSSQDERRRASRPTSIISRRGRGRSRGKKSLNPSSDEGDSSHGQSPSPQTRENARASALQWATAFEGPQTPTGVKSPTRHTAGTQSKRKAEQPASQIRAKRLKGFYNNDYRELLNSGIHEAATGAIPDEYPPLRGSQIGSSVWTGDEKDVFFSALSRLGRHDTHGIALRIGSKSELEVQEYTQLLHQGLQDRDAFRQPIFELTDLPAAFEIGDECTGLLERAGDGLATRQECSEEEKEKDKWGDLWLLTTPICKSIEKQRRESGEQSLEKSLPAANLLDLKNWLELPRKVFMNSSGPREDENWQCFVEPGETPAIRATAFEDFHSLAVSVTKRLMSTVLFCTMSRRRAIHSTGIKHAEIVVDDIEAAVRILGLKHNSLDFWTESARRNDLDVFDLDEDSGENIDLTYDEVEAALRQTRRRSRSRSRSMSRGPHSGRSAPSSVEGGRDQDSTDSMTESLGSGSDDDSLSDQESDLLSNPSLDDEDELTDVSESQVKSQNSQLEEARKKKSEDIKAEIRAQEDYIEAYDHEASQTEENRLRNLLRHSSPIEIKPEPLDTHERPKPSRKEPFDVDWKDRIEYWSPWETMPIPVPEESFTKNRNRISRKARKKRMREEDSGSEVSRSEDGTSSDEAEGEEGNTSSTAEKEEVKTREVVADVQMKDEDNADLYAASSSEKGSEPSQVESPASDIASGSQYQHLTHRVRLPDDVLITSDYED